MSLLALDVQYEQDGKYAIAAGISFASADSDHIDEEHVSAIKNPAEYISGEFYKRELPCILHLLDLFHGQPEIIIVDSYVDLGAKPGMGRHLYNALNQSIAVIGVAKNPHKGADTAAAVLRGTSKKPLYVTSAGIDLQIAAALIAKMHGNHRIPTMLKHVDKLARNPG